MTTKIIKLISASVLLYVITIITPESPEAPEYTIKQTLQALKDVRNIHAIRRTESGHIEIERWTEINSDGSQNKYFQETADRYLVWENTTHRLIYIIDENAVLIYDMDDTSTTWISGLYALFEDMAKDDSVTIKEIAYDEQKLYMLYWESYDVVCLIDSSSRLPVTIDEDEIDYQQAPEYVFSLNQIPITATIIDRRKACEHKESPIQSESQRLAINSN